MNRFYAIFKSMRPYSWIKTFFIMLLGAYFALGSLPPLFEFFIGFIIVGPLLWGGLYVLNDCTDVLFDQNHKHKKKKPIANGLISKRIGYITSVTLILTALLLASLINELFLLVVLLMVLSQIIYTLEPFRFKEKAALGFIVPGVLNPALRFLAGWFLFTSNINYVPWAIVVLLILAKIMSHMSYKYYWYHGLEKNPGDETTKLLSMNKEKIRRLIIILFIPFSSLFLLLCINGALNNKIPYIGYLPIEFAFMILLAYLGMPFYIKVLNKPNSIKIDVLRVLCYIHLSSIVLVSFAIMKGF